MDDVECMDMTFSVDEYEFGKSKIIDLIENGSEIPVTNSNVKQFVQLMTEFKMTRGIQKQIDSFLSGLYEIVPAHLLVIFNDFQLELLISGIPTIDYEDWKENTKYNEYTENDAQIKWFWEIVYELTQEERALLLQFVTGTSRVPVGGFSNLYGHDGISKFTILKTQLTDSLPTSGTWYELLLLLNSN